MPASTVEANAEGKGGEAKANSEEGGGGGGGGGGES